MTHLSAADIEALVLSEAPPRGDARLVHLATCPECARRLAREARAELALQEAVASSSSAAHATSRWGFAAAAMLMLVLAAGLLVTSVPKRPVARHAFHSTAPSAPDMPCLVDPVSLGPGHDVSSPEMPDAPGLNVATAAPTDSLD